MITVFAHVCVWAYHADTNTWTQASRTPVRELDPIRFAGLPYFNGYSWTTLPHEADECEDHHPEPLTQTTLEAALGNLDDR